MTRLLIELTFWYIAITIMDVCAMFRMLQVAPRCIKAQREGALDTRRLGQHHVSQTSKLDTLRCKEQ